MIKLNDGDKLVSMSEVLVNVKAFIKSGRRIKIITDEDEIKWVIIALAAALEESEEFVKGVLEAKP